MKNRNEVTPQHKRHISRILEGQIQIGNWREASIRYCRVQIVVESEASRHQKPEEQSAVAIERKVNMRCSM